MIISIDKIPEELVTEILSRLPVKPLLRFKCVSKSWCKLISSKDFTILQFNNYKASDIVLAGINPNTSQSWNLLVASVSPPTRGYAEEAPAAAVAPAGLVNYPIPQEYINRMMRENSPMVCGPCNGIFCLFKYNEEHIILWNPLIQDFKFVPQSNLPRSVALATHCVYAAGFGFDPETNDYKILQIVQNVLLDKEQIEIYSVNSNTWKKLDPPLPSVSFCLSHQLITRYRKICWLGTQRHLFLFDLSNETIDMIPISLKGHRYWNANLELLPFRDTVAVAVSRPNDPRPYFEIRVLNDFNCCTQSRSWSKLWTIQLRHNYRPLAFCGNPTSYLIFQYEGDDYELRLYDIVKDVAVDVGASMINAHAYKGSLVSIGSQ